MTRKSSLPKMKHPTQGRNLTAVEQRAYLKIRGEVEHLCTALSKGLNLEPTIAAPYEVVYHLYRLGVINRDAQSFTPHRIPYFYYLDITSARGIKPELAHWAEEMGLSSLLGRYYLLLQEHGDPIPWVPRGIPAELLED